MGIYTSSKMYYPDYIHKLKCIDHYPLKEQSQCECYRLIFVESGAGIAHINGKSLVFNGMTFFCLNQRDVISFENTSDCKACCINFHPSIINKLFTLDGFSENSQFENTHGQDAYFLRPFTERTEDYHGLIMVHESQYYRINQLFNKIKAELELQGDKDWPCRSRSFFFELLLVLQTIFVDSSHRDFKITETLLISPFDVTKRIIIYLHTHYHEKISLSQLSKEFNMNRTTLENLFIKTTSMPVIAYIIRLRLKMAAMILRDTRLPISEIITRVGFNDRAHFTRIFKKNLGISPRDYREKYCQM